MSPLTVLGPSPPQPSAQNKPLSPQCYGHILLLLSNIPLYHGRFDFIWRFVCFMYMGVFPTCMRTVFVPGAHGS